MKQLPFIILPYPFSSSTLQYSDLLSPYSSANTSNNIVNIPYVHQQLHRKDKKQENITNHSFIASNPIPTQQHLF